MAEAVRNYPKLANDIVELVGGESNIVSVTRCATRLRLVLRETPAGAKEKVAQLPGVITVVESGGQFQVVIGSHVGDVLDAMLATTDLSSDAHTEAPKQSIVNRVIATMSSVFAPFVYILAAAGLLQGLLIVIRMIFPAFEGTVEDQVFSFISWSPFTFLPILIAISASTYFKTNMFVSVWAMAALVSPDWGVMVEAISSGETTRLFGIALSSTVYTSTVLPPLFVVWILSYLERFLKKYIKGAAQQIFVPLLSVMIIVPLTLLVIGPLSSGAALGIAAGYNWLVSVVPWLAGAIIGGFWQVAVIFGVHWGITPVVVASFDQNGFDTFQAIQTAAVVSQVGAAFGVFFKARSRRLKNVAGPAGVTGIFGITEPIIYGLTLPLKRPFILACVAGGIGGTIIGLFGSVYYAYAGLPGPLTIVNAYNPDNPSSIIGEVIGCSVAFFGAMALVYFLGFKEPEDGPLAAEDAEPERSQEELEHLEAAALAAYDSALAGAESTSVVAAPVAGRVIDMSAVPDEVFASGAMGGGAAIEPSDGKIYAPFDGTVVTVMKTKHAIGLRSEDGVEVLIHIGIDTVNLEGKPFTTHVTARDTVKKGDLLLEVDMAAIKDAGYSTITPVIVTNSKDFSDVLPVPETEVIAGEDFIVAITRATAGEKATEVNG